MSVHRQTGKDGCTYLLKPALGPLQANCRCFKDWTVHHLLIVEFRLLRQFSSSLTPSNFTKEFTFQTLKVCAHLFVSCTELPIHICHDRSHQQSTQFSIDVAVERFYRKCTRPNCAPFSSTFVCFSFTKSCPDHQHNFSTRLHTSNRLSSYHEQNIEV